MTSSPESLGPSVPRHGDVAEEPRGTRSCSNCGAPGAEVFCPSCGERQPDHHDVSLRHFVGHAFHELVHLDSKVFTTLRLLLTRPGALTVDYFAGRKTRHVTPLRLFLTLFAIYFIAFSSFERVSLYSSRNILKSGDREGVLTKQIDRLAERRGMTRDQFLENLDLRFKKGISGLQLANVVAVALVLQLLWFRRYFAEHLVFAAHFLSFTYLWSVICWPFYFYTGLGISTAGTILILVNTAILISYMFFAARRFYGGTTGKLALKSIVAYGGVFVTTVLMYWIPWAIALIKVAKKP